MHSLKKHILSVESQEGRNVQLRRKFNRMLKGGSKRKLGDTTFENNNNNQRSKKANSELYLLQRNYEKCLLENDGLRKRTSTTDYSAHLAQAMRLVNKYKEDRQKIRHILSQIGPLTMQINVPTEIIEIFKQLWALSQD